MTPKHPGSAATAAEPPRRRTRTLAALLVAAALLLPVAARADGPPDSGGSQADPVAGVAAYLSSYDSSQLAGYWRGDGADAIVVAATRDLARLQSDLRTKFPDVGIKVVAARFSRSELDGWVDELMNRAEQRTDETIAVWIDEPGNRVMVETEDGSTFADEARAVVPDAALAVTTGLAITDLSRTNAGPPMQGGLQVLTLTKGCSTGLNAYWDEQISPVIPEKIRHYYLLSAGHCSSGDENEPITHNLGRWTSTIIDSRNAGRVDALIAGHANPADRSNKIYLSDTSSRTITAWQRSSQDAVGDVICLSGVVNNNSCGLLKNKSYNFTFNGVSYQDFRLTDTQLLGDQGDSGGSIYRPFGSNATIAGMAAKKVTINGSYAGILYTHVDYVRAAFGVAPLVTAS